LALERVKSLFGFLAKQNKSDPTKLRLILSTQLLTYSLNDQSNEFSKFHQTAWKLLALSVFFVPILISLMTIFDQTNLLAVIRGSDTQIRFDYTLSFTFKFVIELGLLAFQCMLLGKLIGVARAFGLDQGSAQHAIAQAE
jgi:hypothetical protein